MKGCLKWAGILAGIFIVVSVIIVMAAGGGTSTPTVNRPAARGNVAEVAADAPAATPTPEWMAPSFGEMCDNNDTMTDLQQEDYAASMAGKKIIGWVGKVYDVQSDLNGAYTVQIDMGGIFKSRQIDILNIPRDVAAGLNVDQEVRFDGTIKSVDMFASDICNPINVIEATITPN